MTIFAIDPGPEQSAYVIWDGVRVVGLNILPNSELLAVLKEGRTNKLAIEMIASYGMAVGREVFETCVWIGRFMQAWPLLTVIPESVTRIPRLDVKVHLCKTAKAKDANIRQALIDRFGAVGTKKNKGPLFGVSTHCWAALAVGVTAHDRLTCGYMQT